LGTEENNSEQNGQQGAQVKMHASEMQIDIPLVKRLLIEQFPQLADKAIMPVRSTGTVNALYRLDHDLCLRLPRLEIWAQSIEREWIWLPKLARHISLDIPRPYGRGKPSPGFPLPWAIYHWIEGSPYADDLIGDDGQAASELANFILELRSIDMEGAPRGGRRPLFELDAATRVAVESARDVIDPEAVSAAWTRSLQSPPWDGNPVWIHGDLLKSNLLV
jgi:aminoglycoside phosphotransferase (APT) family kinase protein